MVDISPINNPQDILSEAASAKTSASDASGQHYKAQLDKQLPAIPDSTIKPLHIAETHSEISMETGEGFTYRLPMVSYILASFYIVLVLSAFFTLISMALSLQTEITTYDSLYRQPNTTSQGYSGIDVASKQKDAAQAGFNIAAVPVLVSIGALIIVAISLLKGTRIARYIAIAIATVAVIYLLYDVFKAIHMFGVQAFYSIMLLYAAPYTTYLILGLVTVIYLFLPKVKTAYT
jgi:hypothetical protein